MKNSFWILCIITFLVGCGVEADLEIQNDASGRAEVRIKLHPVAVRYMTDMLVTFGEEPQQDKTVFDIQSIEEAIASRQGMILERIEPVGTDTLLLEVAFRDIRRVLEVVDPEFALSVEPPLAFSSDGNRKELTLSLNRMNFWYISGLFIPSDSQFTVLLPFSEYDFMDRNEYIEVLEYALEDYLESLSAYELLDENPIRGTVTTPSTVKSTRGGEFFADTARFSIPLLEVFTLEEPALYSVVW